MLSLNATVLFFGKLQFLEQSVILTNVTSLYLLILLLPVKMF